MQQSIRAWKQLYFRVQFLHVQFWRFITVIIKIAMVAAAAVFVVDDAVVDDVVAVAVTAT